MRKALVVPVAPLLVSRMLGAPMNLVFGGPLDLFAIVAAALLVDDGEAAWFEEVLRLGVYVILVRAYVFSGGPARPASR